MDRVDRRTFLRRGAGAAGLSAVGASAVEPAAAAEADSDRPDDDPDELETTVIEVLTVGGFLGLMAIVFWSYHRNGPSS